MTQPVDSVETLTKYLTQGSWIKSKYNAISPMAFIPRNLDGSYKLSAFRICGLSDKQIWEIADQYILPNLTAAGNGSARRIHGRADMAVSEILNIDLNVEPDDDPPRHTNIIGWPSEYHEQVSKAQELAAVALLVLKA